MVGAHLGVANGPWLESQQVLAVFIEVIVRCSHSVSLRKGVKISGKGGRGLVEVALALIREHARLYVFPHAARVKVKEE